MIVHLRNARADRHSHTRGEGSTWCGKKLLGAAEAADDGLEAFTSYGSRIVVSIDPARGTCDRCRAEFDAAYAAAFPEGLQPIATFRLDDPDSVSRARAVLGPDALKHHLGPGGGGVPALTAALRAASDPMQGDA